MSSAGAHMRSPAWPWPRPWPWPTARPKSWFISSWIASRSWKGSHRETLMTVLPPLGPGASGPLLLVPVLAALVDDLGVDHVAVRRAGAAARIRAGLGPGLCLAGAGLLTGLGVHGLGQLVARLLQGLGGRGDRDGVVAGQLLLQVGEGLLDAGPVLVGDLVAVVLEALLGLVDDLLAAVLGLGGLAAAPVLLGVLLGLVDHAVDVVLGQRRAAGDGHRLLLAGAAVLGRDVDDAGGVDVEGDLDLRHATRRRRDADELEVAEHLVAIGHLARTLA